MTTTPEQRAAQWALENTSPRRYTFDNPEAGDDGRAVAAVAAALTALQFDGSEPARVSLGRAASMLVALAEEMSDAAGEAHHWERFGEPTTRAEGRAEINERLEALGEAINALGLESDLGQTLAIECDNLLEAAEVLRAADMRERALTHWQRITAAPVEVAR